MTETLLKSVPVLTQEQDTQNNLNSKKVNKIWWARGVDHSPDCKPLSAIYSGNYVASTATKPG